MVSILSRNKGAKNGHSYRFTWFILYRNLSKLVGSRLSLFMTFLNIFKVQRHNKKIPH